MSIIPLKAWYLETYTPLREITKRPHDLRLNRNSLLKSGLRADFLDDSQEVAKSIWFERYLEGETIEFYIEGSGIYTISNIDLRSQEIYLAKQDINSNLEPIILLSQQTAYHPAQTTLQQTLTTTLIQLNQRSRLPLILETTQHSSELPLRLSSQQLRKIRKCLLFIADVTPVASLGNTSESPLLLSPQVCVEIGYALQNKAAQHILLVKMERPDLKGNMPFDVPHHQQLEFKTASDLTQTLPTVLQTLLQRFNLF
jgi:hypothetical protein